jgi:hypothetical protein
MCKSSSAQSILVPIYVHADFTTIKDDTFKLQLLKLANGYIRFDKQVLVSSTLYLRAYTSVVKPGQRFSDETSYLSFDGVNIKLLGTAKPASSDVLKALGDVPGTSGEAGEETKKVKATFKIEINDEEKKVRDGQ